MSGRNKGLEPRGVQRRSPAPVTRVADVGGTSSGGVTLPIDLATQTTGQIDLTTQVSGDLPFANLAQGSALSVLGVTSNAVADNASIVAASDKQVLRRSGTAVGFGAIDLASSNAVGGLLPFANLENVTGPVVMARTTASAGAISAHTLSQLLDFIGSAAQGDMLYRGAASWARLPAGTSGRFLQTLGAGADPAWASAAIGGGSMYSGTTHPQGVQSAGLGSVYQNTANGRLYQKMGGGSTAYGWYDLLSIYGFPGGPSGALIQPGNGSANPAQAMGNGFLSNDIAGTLTGSSIASPTRSYVNGLPYLSTTTGAANGNGSYVTTATASNVRLMDTDCDMWAEVLTPATITLVRFWFGFTSATLGDTDTLGSGGNGSMMMRYSTAATDPGWVGVSQINGAGNQTISSNLQNIAASTVYRLRIRFVRSGTPTVYWSVNDQTEVSVTTNIPATGTAYFLLWGVETKTNATRTFGYRQMGVVLG